MKISLRAAEPKDAPQYLAWCRSTKNNLFDPGIVQYPSLLTIAIDRDAETIAYVPFHPVVVIESLAHKPDVSPRENAIGMIKAEAEILRIARAKGIAECWWMCADESLVEFALNHGYEEVKTKVLRKKVGR